MISDSNENCFEPSFYFGVLEVVVSDPAHELLPLWRAGVSLQKPRAAPPELARNLLPQGRSHFQRRADAIRKSLRIDVEGRLRSDEVELQYLSIWRRQANHAQVRRCDWVGAGDSADQRCSPFAFHVLHLNLAPSKRLRGGVYLLTLPPRPPTECIPVHTDLSDVTRAVVSRKAPSFAVALNCGIGSSSLNADVKAFERLHIVRG